MTNETQDSKETLAIELAELKIRIQEDYLHPERKEQIQRRIAYISFELQQREIEGEKI